MKRWAVPTLQEGRREVRRIRATGAEDEWESDTDSFPRGSVLRKLNVRSYSG